MILCYHTIVYFFNKQNRRHLHVKLFNRMTHGASLCWHRAHFEDRVPEWEPGGPHNASWWHKRGGSTKSLRSVRIVASMLYHQGCVAVEVWATHPLICLLGHNSHYICVELWLVTVKQETFTSNLFSLFSRVGPFCRSFLLENYFFYIHIHERTMKTWIIIPVYIYYTLNLPTLIAVNISCFTVPLR